MCHWDGTTVQVSDIERHNTQRTTHKTDARLQPGRPTNGPRSGWRTIVPKTSSRSPMGDKDATRMRAHGKCSSATHATARPNADRPRFLETVGVGHPMRKGPTRPKMKQQQPKRQRMFPVQALLRETWHHGPNAVEQDGIVNTTDPTNRPNVNGQLHPAAFTRQPTTQSMVVAQ